MIDKITDNNQAQEILRKSTTMQHNSTKIPCNDSTDVSLQIDYTSLINQAMQIPQADTQAVQRAQELLRSGQLECIEFIQEAAGNIIRLGI
jgi:hypothetical protein